MKLAAALRFVAMVLIASSLLGASCGQDFLSVMPGVVNDPKNLSLRRGILSYGQSSLCAEMQRRSVPLRLREGEPAIGRFYPTACFAQQLANQNLFVQLSGYGYAWTNLTKRMAFEANGSVEYDHDFQMDGSTMYVYFRQQTTSAVSFKTGLIEQPATAIVSNMPALPGGASFADTFGNQILKNEIARGFTVIRDDNGAVEFGLGLIEKGQRPFSPYRVRDSGRVLYANDRTEIHQNQREYAGPFEVVGDDSALYITAQVEGAPAVDVLVVHRSPGDQWLQAYTKQAAPTPLLSPANLDEPIAAGAVWKRVVRLPQGLYYVVFDNTAGAGRTEPTTFANDDRAALVSYAVEMGDAP